MPKFTFVISIFQRKKGLTLHGNPLPSNWSTLTLVLLNQNMYCLWKQCTALFTIKYVNLYQWSGSSNLRLLKIRNGGGINLFSRTGIKCQALSLWSNKIFQTVIIMPQLLRFILALILLWKSSEGVPFHEHPFFTSSSTDLTCTFCTCDVSNDWLTSSGAIIISQWFILQTSVCFIYL